MPHLASPITVVFFCTHYVACRCRRRLPADIFLLCQNRLVHSYCCKSVVCRIGNHTRNSTERNPHTGMFYTHFTHFTHYSLCYLIFAHKLTNTYVQQTKLGHISSSTVLYSNNPVPWLNHPIPHHSAIESHASLVVIRLTYHMSIMWQIH